MKSHKLADLLSNLASGQRPTLEERRFLLDVAEWLRTPIDQSVLESLSEKLRSEEQVRTEKVMIQVRDMFSEKERRVLYRVQNLIRFLEEK